MIKWLKSLFAVSKEDSKLATAIRQLYKTHDVTIRHGIWSGWSVSVKKKIK